MTASCCWKMTAVCVIPLYTFWPVLLLFPGVRHGWTLQATLMLILFSALQVLPKLTLALCILCEWPPSSRILLFPHFFLLYVLWLAALLHLLLCLLSLFSCLCWITPGYCVAVQGAEMLSVTGPRSNLMAGTSRESHAKEMSTFLLHFIEMVVFSSVLFCLF